MLFCSIIYCQEAQNVTITDSLKTIVPELWTENWLYKRIYPLIFKVETEREQEQEFYTAFIQYSGKTIANIFIVNLDVFDLLPDKPDKHIYNQILALGNAVHYKTRDWIIEKMLFFAEGDSFDPQVMNRNLVYLKDLPYLREAELLISENENGTVDVFVLVRDKFSLELSGKIISHNKYRIKINEQNILGLGLGLKHIWHIDPQALKSKAGKAIIAMPIFKVASCVLMLFGKNFQEYQPRTCISAILFCILLSPIQEELNFPEIIPIHP